MRQSWRRRCQRWVKRWIFSIDANQEDHIHNSLDFFEHMLEENTWLKQMCYHMPGCFYWKDKNRKYIFINKEFELKFKSYGVSKSEVIGRKDEELFDYKLAEAFKMQDEEVQRSGQEHRFEYVIRWHGEKIADGIIKRPLFNATGDVMGTLGFLIQGSWMQAQVQNMNMDESDKLKLSFIRDMEHDIRTPMSGIVGLSRLLYEKETCLETKENLGLIVRSAEELLSYCNGILEFSKISRGLYPTIIKSFDLKSMVEHIVSIERPAALSKHIDLVFHMSKRMPAWIKSDPYRIEKILMNLVGNAIKFTSSGKVTIGLDCKRLYGRHMVGYLTVSDTGDGIPDSVQTYMHKTFMRGESSNRGLHHGIGIGLQVVKEFIQDLGGDIDIVSEAHQGTHIRLSIPLQIAVTALHEEHTSMDELG